VSEYNFVQMVYIARYLLYIRVTTLQTMWNSLTVRGTPPHHSAC